LWKRGPSDFPPEPDIKPADPIEGILIAQLMAANEAVAGDVPEGLGTAT
jgi:hypothetical protein